MCDCDPPKCWRRSTPRARKAHRCCECRGTIPIGEVYHVFSGVWDRPTTFKTCVVCQILIGQMQAKTTDCIEFGELLEFLAHSRNADPVMLATWIENAEARGGRVYQSVRDALASLSKDSNASTP